MERWNFEKYFTVEFWHQVFRSPLSIGGRISKLIRIVIGSIRGFNDDECSDKASALTFYTLLSIVPLFAVAFGIAKGFGFELLLQTEVTERFKDQPEVAAKLIDFSRGMLHNTQSGIIAGVGLAVLLWSILKLMGNIESAFNAIWKIKTARSWPRRVSDYLAMMLFCPIFFAASSSITVYLTSQVIDLSSKSELWRAVSPLFMFVLHISPLILSWILFSALYYIMPNANVPLKFAALAGFVAAASYQIMQSLFLHFAISLSNYGAIYGSFAALPLFLLWLNTSWLIALAGAEIAYHAENDITLKTIFPNMQRNVDARVLALLIMNQAVEAFKRGVLPPTIYTMAHKTGISVFSVKQIIQDLLQASLLVEVSWRDGSRGYFQPGRAISTITIHDVCVALDSSRHRHYLVGVSAEADLFQKHLSSLDCATVALAKNVNFESLLLNTPPPQEENIPN